VVHIHCPKTAGDQLLVHASLVVTIKKIKRACLGWQEQIAPFSSFV